MLIISLLAGLYITGVVFTYFVFCTTFYNSDWKELLLLSLGWPVILPIMLIAFSGN